MKLSKPEVENKSTNEPIKTKIFCFNLGGNNYKNISCNNTDKSLPCFRMPKYIHKCSKCNKSKEAKYPNKYSEVNFETYSKNLVQNDVKFFN